MNLRGMVTLKCWGSEINSFLLSSFKPTPVGPAQTQTSEHGVKMTEVTESNKTFHKCKCKINSISVSVLLGMRLCKIYHGMSKLTFRIINILK